MPNAPDSELHRLKFYLEQQDEHGHEAAAKMWEREFGAPCPFEPHCGPATIDFETYATANLKTMGAWAYAAHPETEVLCMAYAFQDGVTRTWLPGDDELCPLAWWIERGYPIEAHNVEFELAIWNCVMVPKYGWPKLPVKLCYDSAAYAAACGLPRSLAKACPAAKVDQEKSSDGYRLMLRMCKPAPPVKDDDNPKRLHTDDNIRALVEYCRDDVRAEMALSDALPALPDQEERVRKLTMAINQRGIRVDLPLAQKLFRFVDENKTRLQEEFRGMTGGVSPTQTAKLLEWLRARGYPGENIRKEAVADALEKPLRPEVRSALEIRQIAGKSSTSKLTALMLQSFPDGRLRGSLMYWGAHTGRWVGKGVQPQNLPRGSIDDVDECLFDFMTLTYEAIKEKWGNPFAAVSSCLRGLLIPSEGCRFLCADYSAIEARVLLWLVGDPHLSIFEQGADIYVDMAAKIYGVAPSAVTKEMRQVGKAAILGLGFGMGEERFQAECDRGGLDVDAPRVVATYRDEFPMVKSFWYALERAALKAMANPGRVVHQGRVCFRYMKRRKGVNLLRCRLPSGRMISYPDPEVNIEQTPWKDDRPVLSYMAIKQNAYVRVRTYGGKLTENVVQGVARDVMSGAMLRVQRAGLPIVLTVHDELLCDVPEDRGSVEMLCNLMTKHEPWSTGLPLAAEGWEGMRYKK